MAYAPQWIPQSEKNAQIVDRVLKGANPRDIPVQQPNLYAFVINRKTAREIGLTIPSEVLLRATRVLD
jgi:putative ABC transport system substrate-binding protein